VRALAICFALTLAPSARAQCRAVEVSFQPIPHLQIAVWVEDGAGQFLDTLYVTRATGALGLANRPGNALFKSAYRWPYGRRVMVLPVWAHRRNHSYGYVVMGGSAGIDPTDDSIGHHEWVSSTEPFYCTPSLQSLDAVSCASAFAGSKGLYKGGLTSLYPPRADLTTFTDLDSADARTYTAANDLAAISGATPPGGQLLSPPIRWMAPASLADGNYRILVETSLEADFNDSHDHPSFRDSSSELVSFGNEIFGQPSIVYSTPFTLDASTRIATTDRYAGYGSWDGSDGTLRPPDSTISDKPGTGVGRLALVSDGNGSWRVKVATGSCTCQSAPPPGALTAKPADTSLTLEFDAPQLAGATSYEIRYRPNTPLDDASFGEGIPAAAPTPAAPGTRESVKVTGLKAETLYYAGVRTVNACGQPSSAQLASGTTTKQKFVTLEGCFIATAAYGTPLQNEVSLLRRFRDHALSTSPLGRLLTAIYYTHSPPLAAALRSDERLRGLARAALGPVVALARAWLLVEDARR
jgi:hypothetical protein